MSKDFSVYTQLYTHKIHSTSLHQLSLQTSCPLSVLCCLLAVLGAVFCHLTSNTTLYYYVQPEAGHGSMDPCPHPCHTLSEYVRLSTESFFNYTPPGPDVVMIFLPGKHALDGNLTIHGTNKFIMTGNEQSVGSTVISMGRNLIVVLYVNEVQISWLSITGCRPPTSFFAYQFNTLLMANCTITNCSGTYYIIGTKEVAGRVAIENTTMIANTISQPLFLIVRVALEFSRNRIVNNTFILNSVVLNINDSESVFSDNMFTENSGDSCGPIAVLVIASTMKLQEANKFV